MKEWIARALIGGALLLPAARPTAADDQLQACKTDETEPRSAYDTSRTMGITAPITRVEFRPNYTLVVLAGPDNQEICAVLPPHDELEQLRVDLATLLPTRSATLVAFRHRTDMQKIMAYSIQPGPGVRGIQLQPD